MDGRTYVGYTVDPARRLRQHNGHIKGGAWATKRTVLKAGCADDGLGPWRFLFVLAVMDVDDGRAPGTFFDAHAGLSMEWHLKHLLRGPDERAVKSGRGKGAPRHARNASTSHAAAWTQVQQLRGIPRRLESLRRALTHPKFAAYRDRFVIFSPPDKVDRVYAATCDVVPGPCVLPLWPAGGAGEEEDADALPPWCLRR